MGGENQPEPDGGWGSGILGGSTAKEEMRKAVRRVGTFRKEAGGLGKLYGEGTLARMNGKPCVWAGDGPHPVNCH